MPADLSPVRPGNAERLSRMVQLATTADDGDEPFAAFEALLAAECPRAHARLALEKVTDRGLLYLWKGASSDRPVVLMAHYDVVPTDEGWNPFDVAKSRGRIPTHRRGRRLDRRDRRRRPRRPL